MSLSSPLLAVPTATACAGQKHSASPLPGVATQPAGPPVSAAGSHWGLAGEGPTGCRKSLVQTARSPWVAPDSCQNHSPHPGRGAAGRASWPLGAQGPGVTEAGQRVQEKQTHSHAHSCTRCGLRPQPRPLCIVLLGVFSGFIESFPIE